MSMTEFDLTTKVALIEQKYDQLLDISAKMSRAIEHLSTIAGDLRLVIAANEIRIKSNKEAAELAHQNIDRHRMEFQNNLNEFHEDLSKKIDGTEGRIMGALEDLKNRLDDGDNEQEKVNKSTDSRLNILERWKYALVLLGGLLGYLIIPVVEKILQVR